MTRRPKGGREAVTEPALAPTVEVVLFDVGGVLSEDRVEDKLADLARQHDVSLEQMMAVKDELRLLADLGRISDGEFWRRVLATVGVTATAADVAFHSYLAAVPGTLELAHRLREKVRLAILSNDSRELARARRDHHGFDELFDPILISADIGMVKPGAQIFEYAVARLAVPAASCLFIDNRSDNVAAAREAGLQAIRFEDAHTLEGAFEGLGLC